MACIAATCASSLARQFGLRRERRQVDLQGGQALAEFVVQLARDASPLFLARLDDAGREFAQVAPRALQVGGLAPTLGDIANDHLHRAVAVVG
jgi:hypothetical protein